MAPVSDPSVRLHVVTGKGGTGKTSLAAALALGLTARGQRVLLVEVEERQGISQVLDVAPLGSSERTLVTDPSGGELVGLSVDAKGALLEYLQKFYKLGRAGSVLEKVGAVDFATTVAPGVRDVLLIGKVYEAVGRRAKAPKGTPAQWVYDSVVLDAPPTGRIGRFLGVNAEVSQVAKVGPVRNQADSITRMLQSAQTRVHLVTLLEEMPVQETGDALDELAGLSLPLGAVIANGVRESLIPEAAGAMLTSEGARTVLTEALDRVAISTGPAMINGLLREGHDHLARDDMQQEQSRVLTDLAQAHEIDVVSLPHLAEGVEGGGLRLLAEHLTAAGLA